MADENITSADTQEGAEQVASDAQLLDDLTSLQQATEGMDEAQADGQVATTNEGDADNPSMTRPDNEFKDQRGLPEGGTTDPFALDNTDLANSTEQSNTTDTQFTAQNTTQDATAITLDNVQIEIEGAEGEQSSSGAARGTGTAPAPTAEPAPTAGPTTLTDPAGPTPTDSPPTDPTTPPDTIITTTTAPPTNGSTESGGEENSAATVTPTLSIFAVSDTNPGGWSPYVLDGQTVYISLTSNFTEPNASPVNAQYIVLVTNVGFAADGVTPTIAVLPYETQRTYTGSVDVTTTNGTATSNADYAPISRSVPIATRFETPILDDVYKDSGENYQVSIKAGTYSLDRTLATSTTPVTTTISDDADPTIITLSDPTPVADGATDLTITATVSNPVTGSPLVITLSNGSTITIPVGQTTGTTAPFAETANDTNLQTEKYSVSISSTTGGNYEALTTTDTSEITVLRTPELTIDKSASVVNLGNDLANGDIDSDETDGNEISSGGTTAYVDGGTDTITYTITVENTGAADLTGVKVYDQMFGRLLELDDAYVSTDYVGATGLSVAAITIGTDAQKVYRDDAGKYYIVLEDLAAQSDPVEIEYTVLVSEVAVDGDADGEIDDIENLASAETNQTSPVVDYEVVPFKTPELTIDKSASVVNLGNDLANGDIDSDETDGNEISSGGTTAYVDGGTDTITYTITVENTGAADLTGVKVYDQMFGRLLELDDAYVSTDYVGATGLSVAAITIGTDAQKVYRDDAGKYYIVLEDLAAQSDPVEIEYTVLVSEVAVDGDADGEIDDIENLASAETNQTSPVVDYEVVPFKTPELTIDKSASVVNLGNDLANGDIDSDETDGNEISSGGTTAYVDGGTDTITYTITVENTGAADLTGVKVYDQMFGRLLELDDAYVSTDYVGATGLSVAAITIGTDAQKVYRDDAGKYYIVLEDLAAQSDPVEIEYTVLVSEVAVDGDADGEIDDIENLASAETNQTSPVVDYEVVPFKTPELTIDKSASVVNLGNDLANGDIDSDETDGNEISSGGTTAYVDGGTDTITYTITVENTGAADLTGVKVYDQMFGRLLELDDAYVSTDYVGATGLSVAAITIGTDAQKVYRDDAGKYYIVLEDLAAQSDPVEIEYTVLVSEVAVDGDADGEIDDIENLASAETNQTSPVVDYEVVPFKTPELTIDKSASVVNLGNDLANGDIDSDETDGNEISSGGTTAYVDGGTDTITYTITVENTGAADLTGVKVYDQMFGRLLELDDAYVSTDYVGATGLSVAAITIGTDAQKVYRDDAGKYYIVLEDLAAQSDPVEIEYTVLVSEVAVDGDADGEIDDIENLASAETNQTSPVVDYEVVPFKTPELTIDKSASVVNLGNDLANGDIDSDETDGNEISSGGTTAYVDGGTDTITYTITVENTGAADLTGVKVYDQMFGRLLELDDAYVSTDYVGATGLSVAAITIGTDAQKVYRDDAGKYYIVLEDLAAQSDPVEIEYTVLVSEVAVDGDADGEIDDIENLASAETNQTSPVVDYEVVPFKTPELTIDKSASVVNLGNDLANGDIDSDETDGNEISSGGTTAYVDGGTDTITYTITVENTGAADLTGVKVYDQMFGRLLELDDAYVSTDYVGATGLSVAAITIGTDAQKVYRDDAGKYYIVLEDLAAQSDPVEIEYTVLVSEVAVDGDADGEIDDIENLASAETNQTSPVVDYEVVPFKTPELTIDKSASVVNLGNDLANGDIDSDETDGNEISSGGTTAYVDGGTDTITYTITVENTGAADLTGVKVYDQMFGRLLELDDAYVSTDYVGATGLSVAAITIGTDAQKVYRDDAGKYYIVLEDLAAQSDPVEIEYTVLVSEVAVDGDADGEIDDIENLASAETNQTSPVVDYEVVPFKTPELTIDKSASVVNLGNDLANGDIDSDETDGNEISSGGTTAYVDGGTDTITYTITVENTGAADLTGVKVYDQMFGRLLELDDAYVSTDYVGATGLSVAAITIGTDAQKVYRDDAGKYYIVLEDLAAQSDPVEIEYTVLVSEVAVDGDADGEIDDIENLASAETNQTSPVVDYEVVPFKTPELTIDKSASVVNLGNDLANGDIDSDETDGNEISSGGTTAYVDGGTDTITYTITVENTGAADLTGVKVYDQMFGRLLELDDAYVSTDYVGATGLSVAAITIGTDAQKVYRDDAGKYYIVLEDLAAQSDPVEIEYTVLVSEVAVDGDADGEIDDIENLASAETNQTSPVVDYEVVPFKTPELTIDKSASVVNLGNDLANGDIDSDETDGNEISSGGTTAYVDGGTDTITYTITVENTGAADLTGVKVYDQMFGRLLELDDAYVSTDYVGATGLSVAAITIGTDAQKVYRDDAGKYYIVLEDLAAQSDPVEIEYTVAVSDINTTGEEWGIENLASAETNQTSPVVDYEVVPFKFADVAISKDADAMFVDGAGSKINYTLTIRNEGEISLSNVFVEDTKILGAVDENSGLPGLQFYGTVYTWDDAINTYSTRTELFLVDESGNLIIGNLDVKEYVEIDYAYIVKDDDIQEISNPLESSVLDYVTVAKRGSNFDSIDMGYGTFTAYQSRDIGSAYDTTQSLQAKVFVNVDNTGIAIGVNAGVMAGVKTGNQDHLRSEFNGTTVKQASIAFTNAKDVELAFEASYTSNIFKGVIRISESGVVTLGYLDGGTIPQVSALYTQVSGSSYTFSHEGQPTYKLSEVYGPGLAQNKVYTLEFSVPNQSTDSLDSFDFWVVGDLRQYGATEQIKVVDVQFQTNTITYENIVNTATVYSDQDSDVGKDLQSDEIDSWSVAVTTGSLSSQNFEIFKGFGAFAPKVDSLLTSETTPIVTGTADLASDETLEVYVDGQVYTSQSQSHPLHYDSANKTWRLEVVELLDAGTYNVRAVVVKNYSSIDPITGLNVITRDEIVSDTTSGELVIDLTNPTTYVKNITFSDDSGQSNTDLITNIGSQTISGLLTSPLRVEDGEVLWGSLDNGTTWINLSSLDVVSESGAITWSVSQELVNSDVIKFKVINSSGSGPISSARYQIDDNAPSAPTVTIREDGNNNGYISSTELSGNIDVRISIAGTGAQAGDTLTVNGVNTVLSAAQITAGFVDQSFTSPGSGQTLNVTATLTDVAGNTSPSGSDSAIVDTSGPSAPTVTIREDGNNNGYISSTELSGNIDVRISIAGTGAQAGDTLTVNGVNTVLSAAQITAGFVDQSFTSPGSGQTLNVTATLTDVAGNTSPSGSDSAIVDTSGPSAPTVTIREDGNNNGYISSTELSGNIDVRISIAGTGAQAGDTLTVNGVNTVLSEDQITAGFVDQSFTSPGSGQTLNVTATLTDVAGNTSPSGSDSAIVDTSGPSAPTVTIREDGNNNGYISSTELSGNIDVRISIAGTGAQAGDTLTVNGVNTVLSAAQITAGFVDQSFTSPGSGQTLNVTATLTDVAGNASPSGSDSAVLAKAFNATLTISRSGNSLNFNVSVTSSEPNTTYYLHSSDNVDTLIAGGTLSLNTGLQYNLLATVGVAPNTVNYYHQTSFSLPGNGGSTTVTYSMTNDPLLAYPIAIDLNNDGIEYLSTSAGVTYDYDGDGVAESTAWVSPEDGLLALSQEDGSLKIVFSTQDGETDLQGLAKIYDSNQDGQLNELDTLFSQFGVWQDSDSDGVADSGEFQSLTDRNIVSLDLVSDGIERTEAGGDVFVYGQTTYTNADGSTGLADDAAFVVKSSDTTQSNTIQIGNSGEVVHVPDFAAGDQLDLSSILANAALTRDNLKDYVQLVDGENGTVVNIDTSGHGGEGGWVQVASLDNVHVNQDGVNMFFDPTNQTIDFTQSGPDEWKVEDGDTPV